MDKWPLLSVYHFKMPWNIGFKLRFLGQLIRKQCNTKWKIIYFLTLHFLFFFLFFGGGGFNCFLHSWVCESVFLRIHTEAGFLILTKSKAPKKSNPAISGLQKPETFYNLLWHRSALRCPILINRILKMHKVWRARAFLLVCEFKENRSSHLHTFLSRKLYAEVLVSVGKALSF